MKNIDFTDDEIRVLSQANNNCYGVGADTVTPVTLLVEICHKIPKELFETFFENVRRAAFPCSKRGTDITTFWAYLRKVHNLQNPNDSFIDKLLEHCRGSINEQKFVVLTPGNNLRTIGSTLRWYVNDMARKEDRKLTENEHEIIQSIVYSYNFLMKETKEKLGMFDVIVGNPPYQGKKAGGGAGSGNAIWQKFVECSFDVCKNDGFVCLLHPVTWRFGHRRKFAKAQNLIFSNSLVHTKLNIDFPGVGVMVDWYIAQKRKPETAIIEYTDTIQEVRWPPIDQKLLNYGNPLIAEIFKKVMTVKDNGLFVRKSWGGLVQLDVKHSGNETDFLFAHGSCHVKNPPEFRAGKGRMPHPHIHQFRRKVIFCATRQFRAIFDDGKLGIGDHVHYLLEDDEKKAQFMVSVANSSLMIFLQKLFCTSDWRSAPQNCCATWNDPAPLQRIQPAARGNISNDQIYQHFNLTQKEIDYVESMVK